jgi:hypothetical protein
MNGSDFLEPTVMTRAEPITAVRIKTTEPALIVEFEDREVPIPWAKCSPRLAAARPHERQHAELSPGGYGIHWPLIDEDLSIAGLMRSVGR